MHAYIHTRIHTSIRSPVKKHTSLNTCNSDVRPYVYSVHSVCYTFSSFK